MSFRSVYNRYQRLEGQTSGETCQILRPDYTVLDQTGAVEFNARKFRLSPGSKFSEPTLSGISAYNCFGNRSGMQAGDVIVPVEAGSNTPILTVSSIAPLKALSAFMTDQIGKITEDVNTDIFTNIRFTWLPINFPGSSLESQLAGSLGVSVRKFAWFERAGLKRGMRLIDQGTTDNQRWVITDFLSMNEVQLVNVRLDTE